MKRDTWGTPDPKPEKVIKALKKKEKGESRASLKKELDRVFSIYIRTLSIDEFGMTKCFTCGKIDHWKKLQCGHYISRRHLGTRHDSLNCAPQCVGCNIYNQGNAPEFAKALIKKYGPDILDKLTVRKSRIVKTGVMELKYQIEYYKKLIK